MVTRLVAAVEANDSVAALLTLTNQGKRACCNYTGGCMLLGQLAEEAGFHHGGEGAGGREEEGRRPREEEGGGGRRRLPERTVSQAEW